MASLADLLKQRVVNTSSMPVNVNNNIGMGYRGNLDPNNYKVTTRSGIIPPSIASRDMSVGFLKSPVVDTTGNILNFLTNKIIRPSYNTFAETVNPGIENVAEAFGYDRKNFFPFMGTQDIDFVKDQTTTIPQTQAEQLTADINKAQEQNEQKQTTFDSPLGPITIDQTAVDQKAKNEGLLSNSEVKTQSNDGLLSDFTSKPAKEGSYTYNKPVSSDSLLSQNETDTQSTTTTNQQTKTETKVQEIDNAPVVADPSVEAVATPNNTEVTPTKTFMDKLTNFATSEFGQDFFANLLAQSAPTVGKPQSFGSNLGKAYEKARELQAEREKKKFDAGDRNFAYMLQVTDGPNSGQAYPVVMDDKGNFEAVIDGKKVPVTNKLFGGNTRITTVSNLNAGSISGNQFATLTKELNQETVNLNKLEDFILDVNQLDSGPLDKFINQLTYYTQNIMNENDLDRKALLQQIVSGKFQGLIGANRVDILGPGVLTEQDAQRVIEALGGDPTNFFNNKQKALAVLSDILQNKYDAYELNYSFYEDQTKLGSFSTRDPVKKYQLSEPILKLMDRTNIGFIDYKTLKPDDIYTMSLDELDSIDETIVSDEILTAIQEAYKRYGQ